MENERKFEELEKKFADLEAKLKAALQKDENIDVAMPMRETLFSRFRGEMRKYSIFAWITIFVYSVGIVVFGLLFWLSDEPKLQLLYIMLANFCFIITVLVKLWYWQIHSRYNITREVKRLELRIAELTEVISRKE